MCVSGGRRERNRLGLRWGRALSAQRSARRQSWHIAQLHALDGGFDFFPRLPFFIAENSHCAPPMPPPPTRAAPAVRR